MTLADEDVSLMLKAFKYSADKHQCQRRKDASATPYINHPIAVAEMLWRIGGVRDTSVIVAAILHDTIEDTDSTPQEIESLFGREVRGLVAEVTDDKSLSKLERKCLQVEHSRHLSSGAKQIKLADKIANVSDVAFAPPPDWPHERRTGYLSWSDRVVAGLRGSNAQLEAHYDAVIKKARASLDRETRSSSQSRALMQERLQISRESATALGRETVEILQAGHYVTASGTQVNIQKQVDEAIGGTVSYPPEKILPTKSPHRGRTIVEVRNESTLAAVEYLRSMCFKPAALNFASATTPGGGFLSGARAQEEYLARSSALWACLRGNGMYTYHQARQDPFYSDYVIYSPNVPILRNDVGELLEAPYLCSIITSPAVHASGVQRYVPARLEEIPHAMWNRILKVLAVAERHGHKAIVLGAWGCGAFGNDSNEIAKLFREALEYNFYGAFEHVVFAITDWSEDERFIGPFARAFGNGKIQFP